MEPKVYYCVHMATSALLGQNILLSTLFSDTQSERPSFTLTFRVTSSNANHSLHYKYWGEYIKHGRINNFSLKTHNTCRW